MTHSIWKLVPGTDGYELVAGPFRPVPTSTDSPTPATEREEESR